MKMTPEELSIAFANNNVKTRSGTFWFCGAFHFGKPGDNFYELKSVDWNSIDKKLTIRTSHGIAVIINPSGIEEQKGYGGFRIKMTGDKLLFEYEWNSKVNKLEYTLSNHQATSKHENGHEITKPAFDKDSVLFEFGE